MSKRIRLTCETCGKEFEIWAAWARRVTPRRYCSIACAGMARRKKVVTNCLECGKPIERPACNPAKFCSKSCWARYNNKQRARPREARRCEQCGREFAAVLSSKRRFCSRECLNAAQKEKLVERAMAMRKEKLRYTCPECGREKETWPSMPRRFCSHACALKWRNKREAPRPPAHGKRVWLVDNYGNRVCVRSTWEAEFAQFLTGLGFRWRYESKSFRLDDGRSYWPDFYLPQLRLYIEVKGFWRDEDSKTKVEAFRRLHPRQRLVVACGRREFDALKLKLAAMAQSRMGGLI